MKITKNQYIIGAATLTALIAGGIFIHHRMKAKNNVASTTKKQETFVSPYEGKDISDNETIWIVVNGKKRPYTTFEKDFSTVKIISKEEASKIPTGENFN